MPSRTTARAPRSPGLPLQRQASVGVLVCCSHKRSRSSGRLEPAMSQTLDESDLIQQLHRAVRRKPPSWHPIQERSRNTVAAPEALDRTERSLGVRFPPLFRRIYTEVGDGGFGPYHGLYPLQEILGAFQTKLDYSGRPTLESRAIESLRASGFTRAFPFCEYGCGDLLAI